MSLRRDSSPIHSTAPRPARSARAVSPSPHSHSHSHSHSFKLDKDKSKMSAASSTAYASGSGLPQANGTSSNIDADELRRRGAAARAQGTGTKSPSPAPSVSSLPKSPKSPGKSYSGSSISNNPNNLPTLPPISNSDADDGDAVFAESPSSEKDMQFASLGRAGGARPPPPAPSAATGTDGRAVPRKRRSSSIVRKPSPGVVPKTVVDWEIPRKTLHSSIGFLTLWLYHLDPPSVAPLITVLTIGLVAVLSADYLRFNFPAFREQWELNFGFLMRESEREKVNGIVWYLIGVITVLALYPRDVAVVSILTLSWADTTASTIGRLWGRYTPPLPAHLPFFPRIRFAPRKSLAGFLAASVTTAAICVVFWRKGSGGSWAVVDAGWAGVGVTSVVAGLGGAVVEALDLGLDDNLTLPILSGALILAWLGTTNVVAGFAGWSPRARV